MAEQHIKREEQSNIFEKMSTNAKAHEINKEEPQQKRVKFSTNDFLEELKILENKEIKTGVINCNNALVTIDNQEINLLNITTEVISKIKFNDTSNDVENKENMHPKIRKSLQKHLVNFSSFLNYLGQSITIKELGENNHAIPYKFIVYQENDFRLPRENIHKENLNNFLIIICPTNCQGGVLNFRQLKKKISINNNNNNNMLNYIIFGIQTQYEISKIIKGMRILILFKIFKSPLEIKSNDFTINDEGKLRNLLKNMTEKNVLIPITEKNVVQKICDDLEIEYQQVYSNEECPNIVYDDISDNDQLDYRPYEYLDFDDLIQCSTKFTVGKYINFSKPQINSEILTRSYSKYDRRSDESYEIDYYSFILINPCDGIKNYY
ncbi:uncharacterized protein LOC127286524 [Leptopilina boulardi]|uniref:uncharacterized protein LOC127286524 n=1 Tax=Leptopilina boulardi TaxID=63433 RepID=UPI0021F5312E|nr:uncharacterized protein LOC127286524 [Leptopilina boulardi]